MPGYALLCLGQPITTPTTWLHCMQPCLQATQPTVLPASPCNVLRRAEVEEEGCTRRPLFGRSGGDAAAAAAAAAQRVEYPLYCDSNRERPRFAGGLDAAPGEAALGCVSLQPLVDVAAHLPQVH